MRVSVVMPVFNGAASVASAVGSVQRQRGCELELLIHDDGSTDETAVVLEQLAAEDPGIDVSVGPNSGPAASRNWLLKRASGAYVAFLDHDDVWPDGRLARQLGRLDAAPAAPAVLGETLMFEALDGNGAPIRTARSRRVLAGLLQAGLFRRSAITVAGPFDEGFRAGDDFDFLLRVIESSGPLEIEHEVAVWYRLHPGQWTADLELSGQGTARALAHSLRRRRLAGIPGPIEWRGSR
jgi:glycosyltransferase involved in cell wall biosynthesis